MYENNELFKSVRGEVEIVEKVNKIATWKRRISRAGYKQKIFCRKFRLAESQLSNWLHLKKIPRERTVNKIEGYLRELGV